MSVTLEGEVVAQLLDQDKSDATVSRFRNQQAGPVVWRLEEIAQRARFAFDEFLGCPPDGRTEIRKPCGSLEHKRAVGAAGRPHSDRAGCRTAATAPGRDRAPAAVSSLLHHRPLRLNG